MKRHRTVAQRIARSFSRRLLAYLGPSRMGKVRARNRRETDTQCCQSHDFCDANVFMDEAFRSVTGRAMKIQSDRDGAIWSAAWHCAKLTEFSTE